jgi:hypothetical protein
MFAIAVEDAVGLWNKKLKEKEMTFFERTISLS